MRLKQSPYLKSGFRFRKMLQFPPALYMLSFLNLTQMPHQRLAGLGFYQGSKLLCPSWHHHQKALKLMIETDGIRCGKLMMTMLYFPRKTSFIKQSSNCALVCQKLIVASAPHLHRSSAACVVISSHCQSLSDLVPVTQL